MNITLRFVLRFTVLHESFIKKEFVDIHRNMKNYLPKVYLQEKSTVDLSTMLFLY